MIQAGDRPADEDWGTVLDDGLSTMDDGETMALHGQRLTSAQVAAHRKAAKTYKWFTLFLLSFSFLVSAIVATVRYNDNPRMAKNENGGLVPWDWDGNGLREKENASRMKQTLEYLTQRDISDKYALKPVKKFSVYSSTVNYNPQYLAAKWIAEKDQFKIAIPPAITPSKEEYPFLQRYALAVLFFSTGGPNRWTWKVNFLRGYHECFWKDGFNIHGIARPVPFGVFCTGDPDLDGSQAEDQWDGKRTVTGISLPPLNNMIGTLPPELRHLRYLKLLHIQYNIGISGPIPSEIGSLQHMTQLGLVYNSLLGEIPTTFAQLTKLEMLRLESNKLEGDTTTGALDFLSEMQDLSFLSLDYNSGITGTIPDSISELSKLKALSFANTGMYGTLPVSLSALTELKQLYLDDCAFEGSTGVVQSMTGLTHVYLEDNLFNESIDESFFADLKELVHLDISNCSFSGSVPGHLFGMTELEVLDMSLNNLFGPLPADALSDVQQSKLKYLSLHTNNIAGAIPTGFGMLKNLTVLDLSINNLSGEIPAELGALANLNILFLGKNGYDEVSVPGWLRGLTQLTELSLKSSNLSETIPSWLGELTDLKFLDLGENRLGGTIPQSLGNLTELMVLILNANMLEGRLGLGQLSKLETILIDDNLLTGDTYGVCQHEITHFVADCAHKIHIFMHGVEIPDGLDCPCCTLCCYDGDVECNDSEWLGNHNGIWEYGYDRVVWNFDESTASPLVDYNILQIPAKRRL